MIQKLRINLFHILFLAASSAVVVTGFLVFSASQGFSGFPLDDAWIHQVYARNLVEHGEWAFNTGQPSGGSTSPLWSFLLGCGYLLQLNPVVWSGILSGLALFITACLAEGIARTCNSNYTTRIPWVGLFFVFEWHMIWAAVSGMETILYICLVLAVFLTLNPRKKLYSLAGALAGLCTWIRPDGITLLGPILFILLLEPGGKKEMIRRVVSVTVAFLLFFIPYLVFNLKLAGTIWPSTFSAKQAEYQASVGLPFIERLWNLFLPFLAGGGVILLPGVVAAVAYAWGEKKLEVLAIFMWFAGTVFLYTLRLPVNYQHGRYMMPAMAAYFIVGLWGMLAWMKHWPDNKIANLSGLFWKTCLSAVTGVFLVMGCLTYKTDVAIIQTEMVQTALWIKENTPTNTRVAAHDIGAMGYFSQREIIDLAGLVNPEVIPILRDEKMLTTYMDEQHIDYFVTFPGWYPSLTVNRRPIFQTNGKYSPESGGENMAVYKWK